MSAPDPTLAQRPRLAFDASLAQAHVMQPPHARPVRTSRGRMEGDPALRGPTLEAPALRTLLPDAPTLQQAQLQQITLGFDTDGFVRALEQALGTQTAGYMMQLRQRGQPIATAQGGLARRPPDATSTWTVGRRMHVASVSKLITAIAMTRCLAERSLSPDTPIAGFLPAYWARGQNVGMITFRHLLTHTSGFRVDGSASSFPTMRAEVANGVGASEFGQYWYENMNFGLCRILIPVLTGAISVDEAFAPAVRDAAWDLATVQAYTAYVASRVFQPSGVSGPSLSVPSGDALAYAFPPGSGWDSGDLASMAGGAAWHMSVDEVLDVMHQLRRGGGIMSTTAAQQMLDAGFGIDLRQQTPLGTLYNKNGLWRDGQMRTEQSLAYFLPRDMELVVFANSPIGTTDRFFRDVVTELYVAHIKPELGVGAWVARHGLSGQQYQEAFNNLVGNHGMQLAGVSGYGATGDRYAALWTKPAIAAAWQARHGLTAAGYQQAFDELTAQGYAPVVVNGYGTGGAARFAAIFRKGVAEPWVARHGLTAAAYQQAFDEFVGQGYALDWVSGYVDGGQTRYAAIWRRFATPQPWAARHGLSGAQYQQTFDDMVRQGYMPTVVCGYAQGTEARYACIFRKVPNAPAWAARHGLTAGEYQQAFDQHVGQGYRLRLVNGYTVGGQDRYAAIFVR